MTTPKAIFYGMLAIALAILAHPHFSSFLSEPAHAEVAGKNYRELERDRDFKRAVESIIADNVVPMTASKVKRIIERCSVSGNIHADGYADNGYVSVDGYLSYGDISC